MTNLIPARLRAVANRQAGLISRSQALSSGLTRGTVDTRVEFGRWRRLHPGIYVTFTGPVGRRAWLWAAVLYAGRGDGGMG